MSKVERARIDISAIITEIELIPPHIRELGRQTDDGEAYDIIRRIERRIARTKAQQHQDAAE